MNSYTDSVLPDLFIVDQTTCEHHSAEGSHSKEQVWYWQIENNLSQPNGVPRSKQTLELLRIKASETSSECLDLTSTLADMISCSSGLGKLACLVRATLETQQ